MLRGDDKKGAAVNQYRSVLPLMRYGLMSLRRLRRDFNQLVTSVLCAYEALIREDRSAAVIGILGNAGVAADVEEQVSVAAQGSGIAIQHVEECADCGSVKRNSARPCIIGHVDMAKSRSAARIQTRRHREGNDHFRIRIAQQVYLRRRE